MFKEYYSTKIIDNITVVDIWETFDINQFIGEYNFQYHSLNQHENLMDLSFIYYDTIDDWWIIFLFNQLWDINFCILQDKTIKNTKDKYIFNLQNYDNLEIKEQNITKYLIQQFYLQNNSLKESISFSSTAITTNLIATQSFQDSIKQYIFNKLIEDSAFKKELKIPNQLTAYKIKNEFERLSIIWKTQNK